MIQYDVQREVEQLYYEEADCLDMGRLHDWLDFFTEDVRYWMPAREVLQNRPDGFQPVGVRAVSLIDDDKMALTKRIERIETGLARSETPPSRTRHLITNVRVRSEDAEEYTVTSNFAVFQGRLASEHVFYGYREDRLRRRDGRLKVSARKIVLDVTVLPRTLVALF
jgi:biphenyl 2,3-dioxygenase beta subunit